MGSLIRSVMELGGQGVVVDVECHVTNGLPSMLIVGVVSKAVEESKERVRSAFANSKLQLPRKRITINLAPGDIPKEGTSFDLAIATAVLNESNQLEGKLNDCIIIGELALDGRVRPVRGIIGKLLFARKKGFTVFFIPEENLSQASLVPGITLVPITTLKDLYLGLTKAKPLRKLTTGKGTLPNTSVITYKNVFEDIVGQSRAKRALEIAAAGSHNVLLNGPPGTGKSMLAKALSSILPPLQLEEILEITHIHSLASKQYEQIVSERPVRSPHHSSSQTAIVGGGQIPRPGEISLSHHGVLFLDELPEFSRATLESMRQPLEDKVITVARARDSLTFPASFILIATSNPCPCGHYGTSKPCSCLPYQISKYQQKLSGPIIDRIDLYVDVDEIKHGSLLGETREETSQSIRDRVIKARYIQKQRYKDPLKYNSVLTNRDIKRFAKLNKEAEELLNQAAERLNISARSYMRIIKVGRTVADLDQSEAIEKSHISEALQYRRPVREF